MCINCKYSNEANPTQLEKFECDSPSYPLLKVPMSHHTAKLYNLCRALPQPAAKGAILRICTESEQKGKMCSFVLG